MVVYKKAVTIASQYRQQVGPTLGYGVVVTLQILVLPFLVRVRVAQLTHEARAETKHIWDLPCEKEEDEVN